MAKKEVRGKLAQIIKVKNDERIINTVFGTKGSGKTAETKKVIARYIAKFPKEKVLILDYYNEYNEYKEVDVDKIGTIRGVRRVNLWSNESDNVLKSVLYNFKKGLLVIEDRMNRELELLVTFNRTKDIDVIIIKQSPESLSTRILLNTSVFRFHKSVMSDLNLISRLEKVGFSPLVQVAVYAMRNAKSSFSFCYYDLLRDKVIGAKKTDVYFGCFMFSKPMIDMLAKDIVKYSKPLEIKMNITKV